jgi:hypothetical protein
MQLAQRGSHGSLLDYVSRGNEVAAHGDQSRAAHRSGTHDLLSIALRQEVAEPLRDVAPALNGRASLARVELTQRKP